MLERMQPEFPESDKRFDYPGSPYDESDLEALRRENDVEREEALRAERAAKVNEEQQNNFSRDLEEIRRRQTLNTLMENGAKRERLREKVERLKAEYYNDAKQHSEYAEAERNRGFLRRAWEYFFLRRNASSPDRLNVIALKTRVQQSLAAYRAAKKELEDMGESPEANDTKAMS